MGFVYFFKHKEMQGVKIGMTSNSESVNNRFASFKTYSPMGAEICGVIETNKPNELERKLHKKYNSMRLHGEFFNITPIEVNNEINKFDTDLRFINKFKSLSIKQKESVIKLMDRGGVDIPDDSLLYGSQILDSINGYFDNTDVSFITATWKDLKRFFFNDSEFITWTIIKKIVLSNFDTKQLKGMKYYPLDDSVNKVNGAPMNIYKTN